MVVILLVVAYYFYSSTSAPVGTEDSVSMDEITVEDQQLDELGTNVDSDQMDSIADEAVNEALDEAAN